MGDYFKDKAEAIEYYKNNEKNFEDKPDWLIECIIDFAIQYPNYKEYCEVEAKVKNGVELTEEEKKKYGHLKWDKEYDEFQDGDVIVDSVDIKEKGEYDDIANDPVAREKYNKYNLQFGEQLEPSDKIKLRLKTTDNTEYDCTVDKEEFITKQKENGSLNPDIWDIKKVDKTIKN
jgi:hypothetical protein